MTVLISLNIPEQNSYFILIKNTRMLSGGKETLELYILFIIGAYTQLPSYNKETIYSCQVYKETLELNEKKYF